MFRTVAVFCLALVASTGAYQGIKPHVFHGQDARIEDFPYILSLSVNGKFQHAATILTPNYALTLSSMLERGNDATITLRAGSAFRESGGSMHFVKRVIGHPQFKPKMFDYDYALLEVEPPFVFSEHVQPAFLPKQGFEVQPYTRANVSGWGSLNGESQSFSMNLQFAEVNVLSNDACQLLNKDWVHFTPRMICANVIGEAKNPCAGDRGGPLVSEGVLIGIVVSDLCDMELMQSNIYAKVSDQRSWIDSIVGPISDPSMAAKKV